MKSMKRLTILLALTLVVSTVLPACGKNKDNGGSQSAGAAFELGSKELSFSYFANRDAADTPWGSDGISKWVQDNKKVTIEYVPSNGAAQQRLNTMLVSGDLPDVTRLNKAQLEQFRTAGKLLPLDDYITESSNVMRFVGQNMLEQLKSPDGHIYFIPNWFIGPNWANGNGGTLLNRKIHADLGTPKLETTEDLEAYLRQVQSKYPDVVPLELNVLTGRMGFAALYSSFAENRAPFFFENLFYQDGDTLKSLLDDPAFTDFAVYANRLYRDKLITQDAFTQNLDQSVEKLRAGRVAVVIDQNGFNGYDIANAELRRTDPNAGYDMVWPVAAPGLDKNKIKYNSFLRVGINGAVITTSAENPAEIFAYLDWSIGEEAQNIFTFGPPGVYWDKTDENGAGIPNQAFLDSDAADNDAVGFWKHLILGNTKVVDSAKQMRDGLLPEDKRDWTTKGQVSVAWKTSMDVTEFFNTVPDTTSDEGIIAQSVKDIFDAAFAQMMFAAGEDEVKNIIAKAKSDMEAQNFPKLLDWKTQVWKNNKEKLNL